MPVPFAGNLAPGKLLVEVRGVEPRSTVANREVSPGSVAVRIARTLGTPTSVAALRRFDLGLGHTDYVPKCNPLKMIPCGSRGFSGRLGGLDLN